MAYTASDHLLAPRPLGISTESPDSARSYFYDTINIGYRPFRSVAEVLNYLNTPGKRVGHFSIWISNNPNIIAGQIGFNAFPQNTILQNTYLKMELQMQI